MITPEETMKFFFRAMLDGYVSGTTPKRNFPFPSWKTLTYAEKENELLLSDIWHTTAGSDYSAGMTTIYHNDVVVWSMSYGGWYQEEAIPTLKAALANAYESNQFNGGRGPDEYTANLLLYVNRVVGSFKSFKGVEQIRRITDSKLLGTHWFHGQWMRVHSAEV